MQKDSKSNSGLEILWCGNGAMPMMIVEIESLLRPAQKRKGQGRDCVSSSFSLCCSASLWTNLCTVKTPVVPGREDRIRIEKACLLKTFAKDSIEVKFA